MWLIKIVMILCGIMAFTCVLYAFTMVVLEVVS